MKKVDKGFAYIAAAIAGFYWLPIAEELITGNPRYDVHIEDIVCAALFMVMVWSFDGVIKLICGKGEDNE